MRQNLEETDGAVPSAELVGSVRWSIEGRQGVIIPRLPLSRRSRGMADCNRRGEPLDVAPMRVVSLAFVSTYEASESAGRAGVEPGYADRLVELGVA
jgi:hypothetical protein